MCVSYREAGRVDDLGTIGALHQSEGGVSGFLLIGLFADLTHRRQRQARLEETGSSSISHTHLHVANYKDNNSTNKNKDRVTNRETLP